MIDLQSFSLLAAGLLVAVGIFAIVFIDNLIKKIMGAMFITDGVNLVLVSLGYREGGIVPIVLGKVGDVACEYPNLTRECISTFAEKAGYPLPYALVLTNIVIGAATTAVMLGLVIKLYRRYHSTSSKKILGGGGD
jgi:energy-converting hydrogenase B subunit E